VSEVATALKEIQHLCTAHDKQSISVPPISNVVSPSPQKSSFGAGCSSLVGLLILAFMLIGGLKPVLILTCIQMYNIEPEARQAGERRQGLSEIGMAERNLV
jgi:hypothetical protein